MPAAELAAMELDDPLVIALPRGGVPVAREVADRLGAPLGARPLRSTGMASRGWCATTRSD